MLQIIARPLLFLLLLLSFAEFAASQTSAAIPGQSRIDARHYIIRTSFDRAQKMIYGDTTVELQPLFDNFRTLELDAVGLEFTSVTLEPAETKLKFRTAAGRIIIDLDRIYSSSEVIKVRLAYSSRPAKGVYFVDDLNRNGQLIRKAQIWTQGESIESRHWFPSNDRPDDKATTEQFVTAEKGETVIANGEFLGKTETPTGKEKFHYKMSLPHSTYLTSFIVGTYIKLEDRHEQVPLGFYVYPDQADIVPKAFGETVAMMKVFENLTGLKYPFNKYDQTIVARFNLGGMENITATTLADTEILMANFDFASAGVTDLVSHELSHSWFGNLVTCGNWSELWLNEGFATFMEAAYREQVYGREDYLRKIAEDAELAMIADSNPRSRHALINLLADPENDESMFDTTTYQKGGAVIHMLRETVGTEAFWKGVNLYLERHKFSNVESADLRKAMEDASGVDLGWFFAQWVKRGGYPKLDVRRVYSTKRKVLEITVSQVQTADSLTPAVFILPMNIEVQTAQGTKSEPVRMTRRTETFSIKSPGRPLDIVLDKEQRIPIKTVKYQKLSLVSR